MRKYVLLCVVFLISVATGFTQSTANYTFTTGTAGSLAADANGNVIDMTSGTTQVLSTNSSQDQAINSTAIAFPSSFEFYLGGTRFTSFFATSNGLVQLGSTAVVTGSNYTAGGGTTAAPRLTAFASDLGTGTNGGIFGKLIGTAPNRCYVIEFRNMNLLWDTYTNDGTYQVRFYENTGVIEYVYGAMYCNTTAAAGDITPEVGFSWGSSTNQSLSVNISTLAADRTGTMVQNSVTAATNIANLNSSSNGSRRVFTFTPATAASATSFSATAVSAGGMTINWVDNATNELGYVIYRSTDNATFSLVGTTVANVTNFVASGLAPSTNYFWRVQPYTEGSLSTSLAGSQSTTAATLSGTRTVGATGNYTSLTQAFNDITTNGLIGALVLELQTSYTTVYAAANETYPIAPGSIPGAAGNITVTIVPNASVASPIVLSSNSTVATFNLVGTNNLIIDGRPGGSGTTSQLAIVNTNTTAGSALRFINDASNNTVTYTRLSTAFASASSGIVNISTGLVTGNDNNTFSFCNFDGGAGSSASPTVGVAQNGLFASGSTTNTAINNSGITIQNCNFYDYFITGTASAVTVTGILVAVGNTDWTISGNSFYQTSARVAITSGVTLQGISVSNSVSGNNFSITGNFFGGSAPSCGGSALSLTGTVASRYLGVAFSGSTTATTFSNILGNTVTNVTLTTSSGLSSGTGIFCGIQAGGGLFNIGSLANGNTIGSNSASSISVSSTTTGALIVGINVGSGIANSTVIGNTIQSIQGTSSSTIGLNIIGIEVSSFASGAALLVSNNTIGNTTATNSLIASSNVGGTVAQFVTGIRVSSGNPYTTINANTIVNLQNNATSSSSSTNTRGIVNATAAAIITNNVIRNLSNPSTSVGTVASACVIGIATASTNATLPQVITGNKIAGLVNTNTTAGVSVIGIVANWTSTASVSALTVDRNQVSGLRTSGLASSTIYGIAQSTAGITLYSNNIVRLGVDDLGSSLAAPQTYAGFFESGGQNTFAHNTVYIGGTVSASSTANTAALLSSVASNTRSLRNNIFVNDRENTGGGTGVNCAAILAGTLPLPTGLTASNNIYFSRVAANLVRVSTTNYTIASWQNASGLDAGSVIAPSVSSIGFTTLAGDSAAFNLRVSGTTIAEGAGIPLSFVTTDFDGNARSNFTPTDIGAAAGNFTANDVFAPRITYSPIASPVYGTGNVGIQATITDVTGIPTSGSLAPRIYFRKGSSAFSSTQGVLLSGNGNNGVWQFTIDYSLLGGVIATEVINYYFVAQDNATIPNFTSAPLQVIGTDVNTITTAPVNSVMSVQSAYTIAAGVTWTGTTSTDWNTATNWSSGAVPSASDNVTIASATNQPIIVTGVDATASLLSVASSTASLTISGGTLSVTGASAAGVSNAGTITLNGGNMTVGVGGNNRTFNVSNGGVLTVSNAASTLTINGNYIGAVGSTFNQSAGNIVVDGNGTTSVASGTVLVAFNSHLGSVTGGTLTIVDPPATGSARTLTMSLASAPFIWSANHTTQFGDGVSTDVSTNTSGFQFDTWVGSFLGSIGSLTVNGGNATNRFTTSTSSSANGSAITGTLTINTGSEFRDVSGGGPTFISQNIVNNGRLINAFTALRFAAVNPVQTTLVETASTVAQSISGSGTFANAVATPVAMFSSFVVNNTSAGGVTFTNDFSTVTVAGSLTVLSGNLNIANLVLAGGAAQTITLTSATSMLNATNFTFNNGSANVTLSGLGFLNVSNNVAFGNVGSRTLITGGRLVLRSTSTATARILDVTNGGVNSGNTISGNVVVQRFIPAKATRRFSLLASPAASTIRTGWQQQIFITGPGTGGAACGTGTGNGGGTDRYNSNGFDASGLNASTMFTYDAAQSSGSRWRASGIAGGIANTSTTSFSPGVGYRVLIRGTRGAADANCANLLTNATPNAPDAVTLSASGAVTVGNFAATYNNAGANNWVLVGNPYPAELNFANLQVANNSAIGLSYAIYDPANAAGTGAANTYSVWNNGSFSGATTSMNGNAGFYIASGQAFFVQATGAGNLTLNFAENQKGNGTTPQQNNGLFRSTGSTSVLPSWDKVINLRLYNAGNENLDNALLRFSDAATGISNTAKTDFDANAFSSSRVYLASQKAGEEFVIQTRKPLANADVIPLTTQLIADGTYRLELTSATNVLQQLTTEQLQLHLVDNFTKTRFAITPADTVYSFTVNTADVSSLGAGRFSLQVSKLIPNAVKAHEVQVYPNPATNVANVWVKAAEQLADKNFTIRVLDMKGQEVKRVVGSKVLTTLEVNSLTPGVYMVEVIQANGVTVTEKLIKQ